MTDKNSEWLDKACLMMQEYCTKHEEFMGEDVIEWCLNNGLEAPPHVNLWGNVFRTALRKKGEERVKVVSYAKAKSAKSHGHEFPVYRSLSYPKQTEEWVVMTIREQIYRIQSDLKFKKISIEEFTERMWEVVCDGNTRLRFMDE